MPTKTILSNIYLENFRGFSDTTDINFGSRITLIFGKGSVGKSTIIDAIELLGQSHNFGLDFNPVKNTVHVLSKHNKAKEFTLGFSTTEFEYLDKNKLVRKTSVGPIFKRAIKKRFVKDAGGVFYPKKIDLFSLSDSPNKFVSLSNSRLSKNLINRNKGLAHMCSSEISFIENEYAWKELYEYTYKFKNELITGLEKCKEFNKRYWELRSKENEALKIIKKGMTDIKGKKDTALESEFQKTKSILKNVKSERDKLFEESFDDNYKAANFPFNSPKIIDQHINFLNEGKIPYKEYINYISNDIKKHKKYLYNNNKIYRHSDLMDEYGNNILNSEIKFDQEGKESVFNSLMNRTTLAEYLSSTLTILTIKPDDEDMISGDKNSFQWDKHNPGKTLAPHAMFKACNRMFASVLKQIEKVWAGKIGGFYNIETSKTDFFNLIEENLTEINEAMRDFGYDFKIKVERELSGNQIIMLKKDKFYIPISQGGSGAQYLLSFLTNCLASNDKILLLEEPEKALHAQAQVHLAKFFSKQSKKNQLIIETHSENLLLGLLKEIKDKKISHKDVRVIYVYMDDRQSKIQDLTINENGSFGEKWRDGFFTEKLDLL